MRAVSSKCFTILGYFSSLEIANRSSTCNITSQILGPSLYSFSTWAAFSLAPPQPFLPLRRRRRRRLLLLLVGRRPCRPCSRCQAPLPAARSHKDKCAEKSYPAAASTAKAAAGAASELLYELLAGWPRRRRPRWR